MRRILVITFFFVVVSFVFSEGQISGRYVLENQSFQIKKGINLNGWFEVKQTDPVTLDTTIDHKKIDLVKQLGFDYVRIPLNDQLIFDDSLNFRQVPLSILLDRINYCILRGIKIVVDLHVSRVHRFSSDRNALFESDSAKVYFMKIWKKLQECLMSYPVESLAYECLNEPAAPKDKPELWNNLLNEWVTVIREKELNRVLVVGSNRGNQLWTFRHLNVPQNDPKIILSFHYYRPCILTHHGASWSDAGLYKGSVHYPGKTISRKDYEILPDSLKKKFKNATTFFDINAMREDVIKGFNFAKKNGVSLNVGEFGCRRSIPDSLRYSWFKDLVSVFNEFGVSYTLWGMHGAGFGIWKEDGTIDSLMVEALK